MQHLADKMGLPPMKAGHLIGLIHIFFVRIQSSEVDAAAVVWVDQAEVWPFPPLINVRSAWSCQFNERLR